MQNIDIPKTIKKIFFNKKFVYIFLVSSISLISILAISFGFIWHYRANVFDFLAKEYFQDIQKPNDNLENNGKVAIERIIERKATLSQESLVINTVKKTSPAVVSIIISKNVPKYETYVDPNQQRQNPFSKLFPGFFFNVPQYRQNGTERKKIGGGSGFLVSNDGLIVTNRHVVDQKNVEYTVFTNNGKKYIAKIVARDPVLDVALIKIKGSNFPYLRLGNSNSLQVGQSVIAIGNALAQFRNTVSVGVVSGLSRSVVAGDSFGKTELLDHVIQTDAAINPGNSGGPLLNLSGYVIGVNVAIAQGSQNIGFALPIDSIKSAIESVKATGKIIRPFLGIRYIAINKEMKDENNLSVDYGVIVKAGKNPNELAVIPGSPADKVGIVENDIILEIDGVKLNSKNTLASIIRQKKVGNVITLKILDKGVQKTVRVTLEATKSN